MKRMLAYCEVCQVVLHNPSDPYKDETEVKQMRTLVDGQIFAHCPICKRTQVFTKVQDKERSDNG